jgi:hypothetical protein
MRSKTAAARIACERSRLPSRIEHVRHAANAGNRHAGAQLPIAVARGTRAALSADMRTAIAVLLAACASEAYTPSARPFPLESASGLPSGHQEVQVDVAGASNVFGPDIAIGNVRLRHAVRDDLSITADGGALNVSNGGEHGRTGGTGRAGVVYHGDNGEVAGGVFGGIGGGVSGVGNWLTADTGVVVNGLGENVRPVAVLEAYVSEPVATQVFTVPDLDSEVMRRLPRTLGLQALVGLQLGGAEYGLNVGLMMARLFADGTDVEEAHDDTFFGAGMGVRVAL